MIISVGSWRGLGATTTALLLAAAMAEDESTWLVEADPAGGVLGGRIHFAPHSISGLEQIAFGPGSASADGLFGPVAHIAGRLRVIGAPADPFRAHACLSPRIAWPSMLRDLDGDVVIDAGRLRAETPAWALITSSDVLVLTLSPEVSSAVASTEWLLAGGRVAPGVPGLDGTPVRLAVVDAPGGVAFPIETLRAELAEHWGGWLAWEPDTVDRIHRGASLDDRRLRHRALIAGVRQLVRSVRETVMVSS